MPLLVLRPDQFSGEALTEHIELEDTLSPYVDIKSDELNLEYFETVVRRAQQLFDALFEEGDPIRIVWHWGSRSHSSGNVRWGTLRSNDA